MTLREGMHNLSQEIVSSFEARAAGIASLRDEVVIQRQSIQTQLHDIAQAHRVMAQQQRATLAKGHADIAQAEAQRKPGVIAWVKEVVSAHQAMAQQQRAILTKAHADIAQGEAHRKAGVNAWVKEVASAHQAMARQQRATLAKVHAELSQAEAQRKAGVNTWVKEVASHHADGRREWHNLMATMRTKRGSVANVGAEAPPEFATLRKRVFEYLANHPDGTRLTELEREFKQSRIQMAKVVRGLMNEGKVAKRELLYIAI